MIRLFAPGLFGTVMILFWFYAVLDVIATDTILARNMPKSTWVFVVLFFPFVGAFAWLVLGRPEYAGWRPGDTERRQPARRPVGLEDSDQWTHGRPPMAPAPRPLEHELDARERRRRERELGDDE
ncbi:MAG: hypothetical protein GY745_01130 [Actinomycetia bacterium]|nr:hypothetical protein [Actinomycetes bacterium]MCP3912959.1 hypothetical protein [Actinomycetes bacterium]MCP4083651.1 hypothetical protein [Actinomycetes bacterium]